MTDWMLHYAERRQAQLAAEEAMDRHAEKIVRGEQPDGTMYAAARQAILNELGARYDRTCGP